MTSVADSPYDGVSAGPTAFKPARAGETLEPLTLTGVGQATSRQFTEPDGSPRVGVILTGTLPDGSEHDWAAWSRNAKRAVLAEKPLVGDVIRIVFAGEIPNKNAALSPSKDWRVDLLRRAGDSDGLPEEF
jgi:hypothetical protein